MAIFRFFEDGRHLPFWIGYTGVWTTHEGRLMVSISLQNLVGIDAVVSIIWKF